MRKRAVGRWLGVGLMLFLGVATWASPALPDEVTKDAKGRVVSRTTRNPDKSGHRTTFRYGAESVRPLVIVDEDLDPQGHAVRKVEQRFDTQGRIEERIEVSIDGAGKETGTRTRYVRGTDGRVAEQVTAVE